MTRHSIAAVLFDLDGTLVDTAPDLIGALNDLRAEQGLAPLDDVQLHEYVSDGSVGLIANGMPDANDLTRSNWRDAYLTLYERRLSQSSKLYEGMLEVLRLVEDRGCAWGVVTNKPFTMAMQLLQDLNLWDRAGIVLGGDSLPVRKPDPIPVRFACDHLALSPQRVAFVGDDLRDMQAGAAAGTMNIAVSWGYLRASDQIETWPANAIVARPHELYELLGPVLDG